MCLLVVAMGVIIDEPVLFQMQYKMIGKILMILCINQLVAEPNCPTKTCRCQNSKNIKGNADLAICTGLPKTPLPLSITSVEVRVQQILQIYYNHNILE